MNQVSQDRVNSILKCPVCSLDVDLSSGETRCHNCNADLTAIRRVQELGHRYYNDALALASTGDYDEALEKLTSALQLGGDPGRIRVVMGKLLHRKGLYKEAISHWDKVLTANPQDSEARELVVATRSDLRKRSYSIAALAVTVACVLGLLFMRSGNYLISMMRAEKAPIQGAARHVDKSTGYEPTIPSTQVRAFARDLGKLPDIAVTASENGIRVRFTHGLFGEASDRLDAHAKHVLGAMGNAIARQRTACRVTVVGFTDSQRLSSRSKWGGSWSLGLARSASAAAYLKRCNPDSAVEWIVTSSGESDAPYPNDTRLNMAKNRTIVLRITFNESK